MSRLISRDPFARTELHRCVPDQMSNLTCDWCGNRRARGGLFRYSTESDGGRKFDHRGLFCSKSCHDSFHCA